MPPLVIYKPFPNVARSLVYEYLAICAPPTTFKVIELVPYVALKDPQLTDPAETVPVVVKEPLTYQYN